MSTFLELCVDARREGAGVGSGPTATAGQVGEYGRIVEWVLSAYEYIQGMHGGRWKFLQTEFSFPTVAGTGNYTKATTSPALPELGIWKEDTFRCYLTATGVSDQQELEYIPWDEFRYVYARGSSSTLQGRPSLFTVKPDNSVTFWPIPSAIYTVTGEYFKRPQTMSADGDEPLIPREFQMAIVWKAVMSMAADEEASGKYASAQSEFKSVMHKLTRHQLNRVSYGAPLA
jgi:hypothetical protein